MFLYCKKLQFEFFGENQYIHIHSDNDKSNKND